MKRLVVIGAGISGLAAAYRARELATGRGLSLEILVLEGSSRVGGKARTVHEGGYLLEAGPQGFLDQEPSLRYLVAACGLQPEKLRPNKSSSRRYVYHQGRFAEITLRPDAFLRGGLLRLRDLARVLREPFVASRDPRNEEESLHDFAQRRLGGRVASHLIAPMALGVYAGDSRELSASSAFPRIVALESRHGSLLRGAFKAPPAEENLHGVDPKVEMPEKQRGLVSFRRGMQSLPEALAASSNFEVRLRSPVLGIEPSEGRFTLRLSNDSLGADAVIVATEGPAASRLLEATAPGAASALAEVPMPGAAVVAAAYRQEQLRQIPRGFGALIRRGQGLRTLGCLWEDQVFEGRAPSGRLLIRSILGGAVDPTLVQESEAEICRIAREELAQMTDVRGEPELERAFIWPIAIPQYQLGHHKKLEKLELELTRFPGLRVAGNALHGVGFAAAAANGWRQAENALKALQPGRGEEPAN